jgi:hypothetical protein
MYFQLTHKRKSPLKKKGIFPLVLCIKKIVYLQFKVQIEAIHNKDYSVVKTFKAATSVVAFFFVKK